MNPAPVGNVRVGVLSDTHGSLDNRVFDRFDGVDAILHAGDVGQREIIIDLEAIAPTYAVLGNVDQGGACYALPLQLNVEIGGLTFFLTHGHLHADPAKRVSRTLEAVRGIGPDIVVVGHSHRPYIGDHEGVTFLNPGSASRPRHGYPGSVAIVTAREFEVDVRILDLDGNEIEPGSQV